jgi:hypothetical protein
MLRMFLYIYEDFLRYLFVLDIDQPDHKVQCPGQSVAKSYLGDPISVDFQFSNVSMETILNVSKLLQSKDSAGVDAISNNLLKLIVPTIISPLVHLINLSHKSGYIPVQVKMAVIIPLF